jgi:hypothetical protein
MEWMRIRIWRAPKTRVFISFSISVAGALVCFDAAAEPAGEGPGPHWSSPFHEEIFPHGAGMWRCFHFYNFNMILSCPTTFFLCIKNTVDET